MVKITPKRGFKLIFLESAFAYQKSAQLLNDCTQIKIRFSSSYYLKGANMKPKRYPYSGNKKQPHEEIAIKVNELKSDTFVRG